MVTSRGHEGRSVEALAELGEERGAEVGEHHGAALDEMEVDDVVVGELRDLLVREGGLRAAPGA